MTTQYNGPHDLHMLNNELETRMQEREMNQSGWSMQRFAKRTMYTKLMKLVIGKHTFKSLQDIKQKM